MFYFVFVTGPNFALFSTSTLLSSSCKTGEHDGVIRPAPDVDTCHPHLKVRDVDQTGFAAVTFLDHAQQLLLRDLCEFRNVTRERHTQHVARHLYAQMCEGNAQLICIYLPAAISVNEAEDEIGDRP
jgi:hypothetical protein